MVTLNIEDKNLVLNVKGFGKFLALKSELTIPLNHIRSVAANPEAFDIPKGLRAPGTAIPGLLYAGTFHHEGEKVFWDVRNADNTIVIELVDEDFARLIVEVEDPKTAVKLIEQYTI